MRKYIQKIYTKGFNDFPQITPSGVFKLLASLGHTGRRVVLGHTLNTLWHVITKTSHHILRKLTILCWVAFIAILSRMQPAGRRWDTPVLKDQWYRCLHSRPTSSHSRICGLQFALGGWQTHVHCQGSLWYWIKHSQSEGKVGFPTKIIDHNFPFFPASWNC